MAPRVLNLIIIKTKNFNFLVSKQSNIKKEHILIQEGSSKVLIRVEMKVHD